MIIGEKSSSFISNQSNENYQDDTDFLPKEPEADPSTANDSIMVTDDIYTLMKFLEQLRTKLSSQDESDEAFDPKRIIGQVIDISS